VLIVPQAAALLGVGEEQVRRLVRSGQLVATKVGQTVVIDDDAVDARARLAVRPGRPLVPATAWGALWELSGERAAWLSRADRSRLRARLRRYDAERLVAATRARAQRHAVRVLPAYRDAVLAAKGMVVSGLTAGAAVGANIISAGGDDEAYCSTGTFARLRRDYALADRGQANLMLRIPRFDLPLEGRERMPDAVVAVDLAESSDVRAQRAGLQLLAEALARARGWGVEKSRHVDAVRSPASSARGRSGRAPHSRREIRSCSPQFEHQP
jgi:excisionase family DNA binding protein